MSASYPTPARRTALIPSIIAVIALLATENYLCDRRLATALFLALKLRRPLFLEGEPGVGKTELAKTLAAALSTALLRLQCYEGLDVAQTAYEWNVARQMVEIRLAEAEGDLRRTDVRGDAEDLRGREPFAHVGVVDDDVVDRHAAFFAVNLLRRGQRVGRQGRGDGEHGDGQRDPQRRHEPAVPGRTVRDHADVARAPAQDLGQPLDEVVQRGGGGGSCTVKQR